MKTTFATTQQIIDKDVCCSFPLEIIPNNMGINLCSVEGITWTRQDDGQLVSLTIHFIPSKQETPGESK